MNIPPSVTSTKGGPLYPKSVQKEEGMALRERALHIPAALASCVNLEACEAMELYRLPYKVLGGIENV